jgi:hypothetical protein
MIEAARETVGATRLGALFEPDSLTTHQFLRVYRRTAHSEPEKRLMFAVLSDGVECFQRYLGANNPMHRKLSADAEAWIQSDDSKWPYSFASICEVLNINPSYLRVGLMQWRAAYESKRIPRKRLRAPLRYQYRVRRRRLCI